MLREFAILSYEPGAGVNDGSRFSAWDLLLPPSAIPTKLTRLFVDHVDAGGPGVHIAQTYGGITQCRGAGPGGLSPWQSDARGNFFLANIKRWCGAQGVAREAVLSVGYFSTSFP